MAELQANNFHPGGVILTHTLTDLDVIYLCYTQKCGQNKRTYIWEAGLVYEKSYISLTSQCKVEGLGILVQKRPLYNVESFK